MTAISDELFYSFPKKEFETRYKNAKSAMKKAGIDALVVTERANLMYFVGYRNPQYGLDKLRQYVFILPLEGNPVFISPWADIPFPWLQNVIRYELSTLDGYVPVIKKTLTGLGLAKGRIGFELGREQYMWMSFEGFMKLQKEMPEADFVDASGVLLAVRSVKSGLEVDRIRTAAQAAARGAEKTFEDMKPGMTERELEKLLRINIITEGADDVFRIFTSSGMDFTKPFAREATERKVMRGDQLHFDIIAEYRYYFCDITRDAFVGTASNESKRIWELMRFLHKYCLDALKPGIEIRELATACLEGIEQIKKDDRKLGPQFDGLKTSLKVVGRMGHGVGCEGTEYPSIALWEKGFKVTPQMVFAVNPNLKTLYGFFNTEDNFLVTKQGWELLSIPGIQEDPPIY